MSSDVTLTAEERAVLVFSSGHMNSVVGDWRTIERHLTTCPTCSATAKTAKRIVAARLAAMEALGQDGSPGSLMEGVRAEMVPLVGPTLASACTTRVMHQVREHIRAAVRADPSEATTRD